MSDRPQWVKNLETVIGPLEPGTKTFAEMVAEWEREDDALVEQGVCPECGASVSTGHLRKREREYGLAVCDECLLGEEE